MPHSRWMIPGSWWNVLTFYSLSISDELVTMCQFLCMMAVSCFPMSEKGVIMMRMVVSVCGVHWDNR